MTQDKVLVTSVTDEEAAAISMALHLYLNESAHDHESYKITLLRSQTSWADKILNFRKRPSK